MVGKACFTRKFPDGSVLRSFFEAAEGRVLASSGRTDRLEGGNALTKSGAPFVGAFLLGEIERGGVDAPEVRLL